MGNPIHDQTMITFSFFIGRALADWSLVFVLVFIFQIQLKSAKKKIEKMMNPVQ